ncbi:single-strand binding protein [Thermodesulfobium narugense DSM 14796]|uniref:Single-stranded DNA-binding protein n=1 Tax=Thermodesulfobium narugense DSM 14796 TaxID=747365 RepID=M1E510_9BACT|nr:single-stranded DNA-binding protein [Thermodesulfobium narugense]AEE13916.1 single-strand binding protein [Thermodesulfobium narugense DSM 14796]
MSRFNKVILVGRLVKDPELRYTADGVPVASLTIAVNRINRKNSTDQTNADFFNIVAWRSTAEFASNFMRKGILFLVEGRLQNRSYETKEGSKRTVTEIIADSIQLLSPKQENAQKSEVGEDTTELDDFIFDEDFSKGDSPF